MIAPLSLSEISALLAAPMYGSDKQFMSVSTDSRSLNPGDLFVALQGESFDGNDYVEDAKQQGAAAYILSEKNDGDISHIVVDDTTRGLAEVSRLNRQQFTGPLVAITGSSGKTSCKQLISAVLSQRGPVLATQGNFNNEIGVPLTLLEINQQHQFAVIEMGASKRGDIRYLCEFAKPTIALVTNISPAHLESFGSLDAVAETKSELYRTLTSDDIAVVNLDEKYASQWCMHMPCETVLSFSLKDSDADIYASNIVLGADVSKFLLHYGDQLAQVTTGFVGMHNVSNALAAAAVAKALDLSIDEVVSGLAEAKNITGRQQSSKGKYHRAVIDDSYNANPDSVKAAINTLTIDALKTCLILGDMGELGPAAASFHEQIGRYASECGVSCLLVTGEFASDYAKGFEGEAHIFSDQQSLINYCREHVSSETTVLVKGSRYTRMDRVANALIFEASTRSEKVT